MFPRLDNVFKKKESLSFEEAHSNVWRERPNQGDIECWKEWWAYMAVGILVGSIAWILTVGEGIDNWVKSKMIDRI